MVNNILQLIASLFIFVLVLALTYYVTKWIAKSGAMQSRTKNIKVIETYKIAPSKYIQIVQIAEKVCAIGVTKEQITFLTELNELSFEDLEKDGSISGDVTFKEVMKNMLSNVKNRDEKK
ncbi:MAG: flagellar biosynthetic protein FliO [Eubacterium sp.]